MGDQILVDAKELARLREIEFKYKALLERTDSDSLKYGDAAPAIPPQLLGSSPNPDWKPRENQGSPFTQPHISFDPSTMEGCYQFLISIVTPRPIALVSTVSKDGVPNLAPYSYFAAMGHNPPMVAIGFCDNHNKEYKDSLRNIIDNDNQFAVNIIGEWMVESANFTCGPFPPEVDEFEVSGLTPEKCIKVNVPRVKESACSMECIAKETRRFGTTTIVLAEIVQFHVQPEVLDPGHKLPVAKFDRYRPVSRLGGVSYGLTKAFFDIPRPGRDDWK